MANEFVARNGIIALDNSTISGSLNVINGITGSLEGTASFSNNSLSSSYAITASYAMNGGGGGDADFSAIPEDVLPLFDEVFDIGSTDKKWYDGYFTNKVQIGDTGSISVDTDGDFIINTNIVVQGTVSGQTGDFGDILISGSTITAEDIAGEYGGSRTLTLGNNTNISGSVDINSEILQNGIPTPSQKGTGIDSVVANKHLNIASGEGATVSGGGSTYKNAPFSPFSPKNRIGTNTASGNYSTIGGGVANTASCYFSTVGGGRQNTACGYSSNVSGGRANTASSNYSTISGGFNNTASSDNSTVSGGFNNTASSDSSTVSGGIANTASGTCSTVGGGIFNTASGYSSTVGGGVNNTASGTCSTVGGGIFNTASGYSSTVGGGFLNTANCTYSTVGGGRQNTACGYSSNVGGGGFNTSSGIYSTVGGGVFNIASGDYSWAGGRTGRATDACSFAWGAGVTAGSSNVFCINNAGCVYADGGYCSTAGGDYAEFFPNHVSGTPLCNGRFVSLCCGETVGHSNSCSSILGVVSTNAAIVGDAYDLRWKGMYMIDKWGNLLWEEVTETIKEAVLDEQGNEIEPPVTRTYMEKVLNPDFDPNTPYVPRNERRNEWTPVGLLGKLLVEIAEGQTIQPGDKVISDNEGKAIKTETGGYPVLTVDQENNIVKILFK